MERRELIRRLVLNSICDDFENVDQSILPDVARHGSKFGLTIVRSEIVDTLKDWSRTVWPKRTFCPAPWAQTRSQENFQACPRLRPSKKISKRISTSRKKVWIPTLPTRHGSHLMPDSSVSCAIVLPYVMYGKNNGLPGRGDRCGVERHLETFGETSGRIDPRCASRFYQRGECAASSFRHGNVRQRPYGYGRG